MRVGRTKAIQTADLKSGPPLVEILRIHQNIPANSSTKLTPCLSIDLICHHLLPEGYDKQEACKKISLLLQVECMSAAIIKSIVFLLCIRIQSIKLAGTTSRSRRQQDCQQTICFAKADHVHHHARTSFQLLRCFRKTSKLAHKLGTACLNEMTSESDE